MYSETYITWHTLRDKIWCLPRKVVGLQCMKQKDIEIHFYMGIKIIVQNEIHSENYWTCFRFDRIECTTNQTNYCHASPGLNE